METLRWLRVTLTRHQIVTYARSNLCTHTHVLASSSLRSRSFNILGIKIERRLTRERRQLRILECMNHNYTRTLDLTIH